MSNRLFEFDQGLLERAMAEKPRYLMGVDTSDKYALAYCLSKEVDGAISIVLCKTMNDEFYFHEEVRALVKAFDAELFFNK